MLVKSYQFTGIDFGTFGQKVQSNRKQSGILMYMQMAMQIHFIQDKEDSTLPFKYLAFFFGARNHSEGVLSNRTSTDGCK